MNYIILDMEWNQGYPEDNVFVGERKKLSGEIIQFGAVKLDENFSVTDVYSRLVKPIFYKRIHFKVRELTGIDKELLHDAEPFTVVFSDFLEWCGAEHEFLIWGCDDIAILNQNIEINNFSGYKVHNWYNLQVVYNAQYKSEHKQVALSTACDFLGISQERQLHNALNDALYTAEICKKMNMHEGLELCRKQKLGSEENCRKRYRYYGFDSGEQAYGYAEKSDNSCPLCGKSLSMKSSGYVKKYSNQFFAVRECERHGYFTESISVSHESDMPESKFKAVKTVQRVKDYETALESLKTKKRRRRSNVSFSKRTELNREQRQKARNRD